MDDHEYFDVLRGAMHTLTEQFEHPADVDAILRSVTASSVELIDGVESADVLLVAGPDRLKSVAATSQIAVDIDDLQKRFCEGPCLDAATGNPVVVCNDLRDEARWPNFAESAVAAGIHSMMSLQLYTNHSRRGALNLFGRAPGVFNPEKEAVAAMLATHAAIALIADDERLQFKSALASRDVIGQAKGMIMERFDVDAVRAFELLKKLSQSSNTRLVAVAEELVARGSEKKS
jgi:transcriptional regulator with GAF, ATPase, and Fis domain